VRAVLGNVRVNRHLGRWSPQGMELKTEMGQVLKTG
jgi:hypothetical protein